MDPVILRWCKTKETGKLWSFETGIWRSSTAAITQNTGDSSEMNCPKGRSFGCCKDSHMKVHTLVACTFFISRGKWKGHYNDGRSNKDNSVVNWNKCSKQCVQNLFKSSFAGVYGKSLATPSKTQCNMFGCEEAK